MGSQVWFWTHQCEMLIPGSDDLGGQEFNLGGERRSLGWRPWDGEIIWEIASATHTETGQHDEPAKVTKKELP